MVHVPEQRQQSNCAAVESDDDESSGESREKVASLVDQIMALLKLTFGVSSKLVRPTLEQLLSKSIPTINYIYNHATPQRLRDWLRIVQASGHNSLQIITQTPKGKELSDGAIQTASNAMHLLTSANSRQLIIELMGTYVKLIDALRSPETKTFLTSLPVLLCRLVDTIASGEAKCLYHSSTDVILGLIETMGQPETTLALAEVTAELCHVLEMEREFYGPWSRRRRTKRLRRSRRRRIRLIGYASGEEADKNAKRRYGRNRYIRDTYRNRTLVKDKHFENDESDDMCDVEDAILSSLGDGTIKDNAWFGLGNQDVEGMSEDEVSLPSRVVLHKTQSTGNTVQDEDTVSIDFGQSLDPPGKCNTNIERNLKSINMDYLRSSIKDRERALSERQEVHPKRSVAPLLNDEGSIGEKSEDDLCDADIEDLVLNESAIVKDADSNDLLCIEKLPQVANVMNPSKIVVGDEDRNICHDDRNHMGGGTLLTSNNLNLRESSAAFLHYYRALEEIHRKNRDDSVDQDSSTAYNTNKEKREQTFENGSTLNSQIRSTNLTNQKVRVRGGKTKTYQYISNSTVDKQQTGKGEDETTMSRTSHLLSLITLNRKQKQLIAMGCGVFIFFSFLSFGFTCYGVYKFFIEKETTSCLTNQRFSSVSNEIVIRIVHDNAIIGKLSEEDTLIHHITNAVEEGVISQDYNFKGRVQRSLEDIYDDT